VIFRGQQAHLKFKPEGGMAITGLGRVSVYEPRGSYQIILEHLEPAGRGALQIAFEQLKARLADLGYFDEDRKRPLPFLPLQISLITSPGGAVVHDMLNTVKRRFSNVWVDIIPVSVQGADAIPEIVAGFSLLNRLNRSDVAVLARGGGSLEDLQAFNSEAVAMAIADSRIPVVSAVGHETDYTIADFVADLRAPTPSAAIEMILPRKDELSDRIDKTMRNLKNNYINYIDKLRYNYAYVAQRLVHPLKTVQDLRLHLDDEFMRLGRQIRIQWQAKSQQLAVCAQRLQPRTLEFQLEKYKQITEDTTFKLSHTLAISISDRRNYVQALSGRLSALNPMAVLDRGYSITRTRPAKTVVTRTEQIRVGQTVDVILSRGRLQCQVEGKSEHGKKDL